MGVYIKGIDMPKGNDSTALFIYPDGVVVMFEMFGPLGRYTAVPVLPHGRLGDLDELYRRIKAECNPYGNPTISYDDGVKVLGIIGSTPTIIPAEEE